MATSVFRRVVAPTDFSDCAEGLGLAQRTAQALGPHVVLVHVFVEPPLYGDATALVAAWKVLVEAEEWVADEL